MRRLGDTPEFRRIRDECCRFCGNPGVDPHHIVYRSLGGTDDERNILPVCRACHDDIHAKKVDPLPLLDLEEQSYAVSLIGIERAHRLLAPSVYQKERDVGGAAKAKPERGWAEPAIRDSSLGDPAGPPCDVPVRYANVCFRKDMPA